MLMWFLRILLSVVLLMPLLVGWMIGGVPQHGERFYCAVTHVFVFAALFLLWSL